MLPPNNPLCPCGNMCTLGDGVCFLPSVPGRGVLDQQNAVEVTWTSESWPEGNFCFALWDSAAK